MRFSIFFAFMLCSVVGQAQFYKQLGHPQRRQAGQVASTRPGSPFARAAAASTSLPINEAMYSGSPGNWQLDLTGSYIYTPFGKLASATYASGGQTVYTLSQDFDQYKHLTSRITESPATGNADTNTYYYTYDAQQRMLTSYQYERILPNGFNITQNRFVYTGSVLDSVFMTNIYFDGTDLTEDLERIDFSYNASNVVDGYRYEVYDNQPGQTPAWVVNADIRQMRLANNLTTFDPYDHFVYAEGEGEENIFIIGGKGTADFSGSGGDSIRFVGQQVGGRITWQQEVKIMGSPWLRLAESVREFTPQGHPLEVKDTYYDNGTPDVIEWRVYTNTYDQVDNRTEVVIESRRQTPFSYQRSVFSDFITATRRVKPMALAIYPNPSRGHVFVQGLQTATPYTLLNMTGIAVRKGMLSTGGSVATEGLPPGLYRLQTAAGFAQVVVQ